MILNLVFVKYFCVIENFHVDENVRETKFHNISQNVRKFLASFALCEKSVFTSIKPNFERI
jgi:hypothetical protein